MRRPKRVRRQARRPLHRRRLAFERLELRTLLAVCAFDPTPTIVGDISPAAAGATSSNAGSLVSSDQADGYTFRVSEQIGNGRASVSVDATGGNLIPRLTLFDSNGNLLIQSDGGRIDQHLRPGDYSLGVSAQSGTGGYRLETSFVLAVPPLEPLAGEIAVRAVAIGDLNGDAIPDAASVSFTDNTISVFIGNGDTTFQPARLFGTGAGPISLTIADVNGDGRPDLLTPNKYDNSVSVLLGNGDATFGPAHGFAVGTRPGGVDAADLNGDGFADLAASNYTDSTVSVLLGNGDGTFQEQRVFETGGGPGKLAIADFNGDGIPDLITPNYYSSTVSVLLGTGDGSMQPRQDFPTGAGPYSVAVGDVNGDGIPDVVTSNFVDSTASVLLGRGDGTFQPQQSFGTGREPYAIALADVNGDGHLDIATVSPPDSSTHVLLGRGDGTFGAAQRFAAGRGAGNLVLGDLDGDGRPDLLTADFFDDTISVLPNRGDGTFVTRPTAPAPAPNLRPYQVVSADVNGDGRPDILAVTKGDSSVNVLLGNADGAFRSKQSFAVGKNPQSLAVADINGDGIPDVVTVSYTDSTASLLLGNGDGTFQAASEIAAGASPYDVRIADVTGDGFADLVIANSGDSSVSVLQGRGDGTFGDQLLLAVDTGVASNRTVTSVRVGDFNDDGKLDIAAGNFISPKLAVFLGHGDGSFEPQQLLDVGGQPITIEAQDFNGDGITDLASVNLADNTISVVLSNGDGTFLPQQVFPAGSGATSLISGDFTGDGVLDLVTSDASGVVGNLLPGNGDGTFGARQTFPAATPISGATAVDLDGDGKLDLMTFDHKGDTLSELFGRGDGTFRIGETLVPGRDRFAVSVVDVNGDGKPDVIKTNREQDMLLVDLGSGTGTFETGGSTTVGAQPTGVATADLNRDGRVDAVTANSGDNTVSVLLGNGDGTFGAAQSFGTGQSPRKVIVADVNGDGAADLLVTNYNDGTVSVLLGNGDGSFAAQQISAVGQRPYGLLAADVDGDSMLDLVVTDSADDTVSVLLGNGDGTFQTRQSFPTGRQPLSVAVGDLNDDGLLDLIAANAADNSVSVLIGRGDGSFDTQQVFPTGLRPLSVTAVDVNGDGLLDLVTANANGDDVSLLFGIGDGSFRAPQSVPAGAAPAQVAASDLNDDGRPDLVTVSSRNTATDVLISTGGGAFQRATFATEVNLRDTPLRADLDGDGIPDSVVLDRAGNILFRKRLAVEGNSLAPPVILNPGRAARDIAIVDTGAGMAIAAADAQFDPVLSTTEFVFSVSLYSVGADGAVTRATAFTSTALPVRLLAADLTGDGLTDLIAANPLDNSVAISLQTTSGLFAAPIIVPTGITPASIAVADVDGDQRPDVLVGNQASGDVSVLLNDASHCFSRVLRFRAGTQPYSLEAAAAEPAVTSFTQPVSLVAGDFTGDGLVDALVVNRGAHNVTLLAGNGRGGFDNPRRELVTSTSDGFDINNRPGAVQAGDFDEDGLLDLALLMEDSGEAWIFTGRGDGTFEHTFTVPVGDQATGLSTVPSLTTSHLDLLVGNGFGDVLQLEGKGDGTFQIQGKRVSLSVVPDLFGPGQAGVLVGNQKDNRVTVQTQTEDGTEFETVDTLGADNAAQLAPGDVQWSMLARDATLPDAIVVSTGGNAVIVYHTIAIVNGAPVFADSPQTLFVGNAPASLTVADVNADGIPDMLVANRGSNDVSVLFGSYAADGSWRGVPGPRLTSGGAGPVAVTVRELTGDNIVDLAVTNGASGTITLLPGVGQGFFDDQNPQTLIDVGAALLEPPSFVGDSGLGYAVATTGRLVQFDLSDPGAGARVVFSDAPVLTARALRSGQVVVAIEGGSVRILRPEGNGLVVESVLTAQAGAPVLASSLVVLPTAAGAFQVLVSSQGSDTVSVFAQTQTASTSLQSSITLLVSANIPTQSFSATASSSVSFSAANATSPGQGISLASFSSLSGLTAGHGSSAALVSLEGNRYSAVPLLDFGTLRDDESGDGRARMPELSMRHPIGPASPLTQFITGREKLIDEYLRDMESLEAADEDKELADKLWNEDLFFQQGTLPDSVRGAEVDAGPQPDNRANNESSGEDPADANAAQRDAPPARDAQSGSTDEAAAGYDSQTPDETSSAARRQSALDQYWSQYGEHADDASSDDLVVKDE